jgi:chromosome segregation ATPase
VLFYKALFYQFFVNIRNDLLYEEFCMHEVMKSGTAEDRFLHGQIININTKVSNIDKLLKRVIDKSISIDSKVDKLEIGQREITERLSSVETKVDNLETKVDNLEVGQKEINRRLDNLEDRFDNLETKVDTIGDNLNKLITHLTSSGK